jgi:hypothetical protein
MRTEDHDRFTSPARPLRTARFVAFQCQKRRRWALIEISPPVPDASGGGAAVSTAVPRPPQDRFARDSSDAGSPWELSGSPTPETSQLSAALHRLALGFAEPVVFSAGGRAFRGIRYGVEERTCSPWFLLFEAELGGTLEREADFEKPISSFLLNHEAGLPSFVVCYIGIPSLYFVSRAHRTREQNQFI